MITEQALQEAIAECQGQKTPNRDTCMMLAAFYTIQDHLYPKELSADTNKTSEPSYSYAAPEPAEQVSYDSGSEFSDAIRGRDVNDILPILDDAMNAVKAFMPRLYNGIMNKLTE